MPGHSAIALKIAALGLLTTALSASAAATEDSFFEDFERFDTSAWYVSSGWTNGPHQNCLWSNEAVGVADGMLTLRLQRSEDTTLPLICGEVQSDARYRYGTFEARLRTDRASGANAAFFTYIGEVHGQPHDEIDVEILTRDPGRVSFNTFVAGEMMHGATVPIEVPADTAFHTYSFIWEPDRIRWYIDGALVHETEGDVLPGAAQKIYLSHWSSGTLSDWMGPFTDPRRSLEMQIDWVAWTAPGERCRFEASVLCSRAVTQ